MQKNRAYSREKKQMNRRKRCGEFVGGKHQDIREVRVQVVLLFLTCCQGRLHSFRVEG